MEYSQASNTSSQARPEEGVLLICVLHGSHVPRRDVVRLATRRPRHAFLRHLHGRRRHVDLHVLDHVGEQLDADAGRLRIDRRGSTPIDWWAVVFNPSFLYRLPHMVLAAFLTTAFVIGGISANYLLQGRFQDKARLGFKCALAFVAIVAPLQIIVGDASGLEVRENQPAKLAAIEARWDTESSVPLTLFAIPDEKAERNDFALDVPRLGSLTSRIRSTARSRVSRISLRQIARRWRFRSSRSASWSASVSPCCCSRGGDC